MSSFLKRCLVNTLVIAACSLRFTLLCVLLSRISSITLLNIMCAHGAAVNDTNFAAVKVNCAAPPARMEAAA